MNLRNTVHSLLHSLPLRSSIDTHEQVVFFPTAADLYRAALREPHWHIPIHGNIYKPAEFSRLRRAGLALAERCLSRKARHDPAAMAFFKQRAAAFLADNERWHRIQISFGSATFKLKRSSASGHFQSLLDLPASQIPALLNTPAIPAPTSAGQWLSFRALTRATDKRTFGSTVLLLPPKGLSVISDIDDTIKITQVAHRRTMLANTFLKDFASVPEMAALYRRWAQAGAAFHYVSASPWHLYPFLAEFLHAHDFPPGTFHLRDLRLMPSDLHRTLRPGRAFKLRHARALLQRFPNRRFILIGDSGESDPAIYAAFFRQFPAQIQKICIRNITNDPPASPRWQKTFRKIPTAQWQIFSEPAELA